MKAKAAILVAAMCELVRKNSDVSAGTAGT